jgi:DNA-binding NtrC family response regulator
MDELVAGIFRVEPIPFGLWRVGMGAIPMFYCDSEEKAEMVCELFGEALQALSCADAQIMDRVKAMGDMNRAVEMFEVALLSNALGTTPNQTKAAEALGLKRSTFLAKVEKYGLTCAKVKDAEPAI